MARSSSGVKWLRESEAYTQVSAICGVVLCGGVINDAIQYTVMEQPYYTTQSFTFVILVFHVIAFLLSIQAFVYATLTYKRKYDRASCSLTAFNGVIFLARIILELILMDYRREYYNS